MRKPEDKNNNSDFKMIDFINGVRLRESCHVHLMA